jgi:hypothetical protein
MHAARAAAIISFLIFTLPPVEAQATSLSRYRRVVHRADRKLRSGVAKVKVARADLQPVGSRQHGRLRFGRPLAPIGWNADLASRQPRLKTRPSVSDSEQPHISPRPGRRHNLQQSAVAQWLFSLLVGRAPSPDAELRGLEAAHQSAPWPTKRERNSGEWIISL